VHGISTQQQQFEQWQQQQQQHFNGAAFNSAPQQYAQMGAAGGVGALWANNPYNNRGGEFENVPNGFPLNY
jgi:hypothetical protein